MPELPVKAELRRRRPLPPALRTQNAPRPEEGESEDWIVSYMDMVTLLMIVFLTIVGFLWVEKKARPTVISLVQQDLVQEKWRPFSEEAVAALAGAGDEPEATSRAVVAPPPPPPAPSLPRNMEIEAETRAMAERWADAIQRAGIDEDIRVLVQQNRVSLEIRERILFASGQAELQPGGATMIARLAGMLKDMPGIISVEGHTDDVPVRGGRYGSNWELSAARASAVVQGLIGSGMATERLRVVAYADTRPLASNDSPDGRAKNRRVTLVIEESRRSRL